MKFVVLVAILVVVVLSYADGRKWRGHKEEVLRKFDKLEVRKPSSVNFHRGRKQRPGGHHKKHPGTPSVHDDEWLKMKHLKMNHECKRKCEAHEICIRHPRKSSGYREKCVSKQSIREGRRLFKSYHSKKQFMKQDMGAAKQASLKDDFMKAEQMRDVYDLMHDYKSKTKPSAHIDVDVKHHNKEASIYDKDLSRKANSGHCSPNELYELRKRLTGWFVMIHSESRQHHHQKQHHHNDKSKLLHAKEGHAVHKRFRRDVSIETETHGHCKCSKSVMWEFRKQDVNTDHHLSHTELATVEENRNEPCMKTFLKTCDRDHDNRLSHMDWCCCLADVVAPCAEKAWHIEQSSESSDWKPRCDREGYYRREQCDKSGYCWCVDLNGNTIHGTKTRGKAGCGKYDPNGQLMKP